MEAITNEGANLTKLNEIIVDASSTRAESSPHDLSLQKHFVKNFL